MKIKGRREKVMKKRYRNLVMAAAVTIAWLVGTVGINAQAGDPAVPPKPVTVINTTANPVPVVGTITGSVTGSVSITNSPTVRIDTNNNTVKIDPSYNKVEIEPGTTGVLLNTGIYDISATSFTPLGPFDVSRLSKIRVIVRNRPDSDRSFEVAIVDENNVQLDEGGFVELQPGQTLSRVYEVPGRAIRLLFGGYPNTKAQVIIYGR